MASTVYSTIMASTSTKLAQSCVVSVTRAQTEAQRKRSGRERAIRRKHPTDGVDIPSDAKEEISRPMWSKSYRTVHLKMPRKSPRKKFRTPSAYIRHPGRWAIPDSLSLSLDLSESQNVTRKRTGSRGVYQDADDDAHRATSVSERYEVWSCR